MGKELLITPSLYTFFLYCLINDDWDKSDYVFSSRIPMSIHVRLKELGLDVYSERKISKNKILAAFEENIRYVKYLFYSRHKHYDKIYGNDEFHLSYKYRNQGIEIIEDGTFNSETKQFFKRRRIRQDWLLINFWFYWFWRNYIPYGYDRCVKRVWHTSKIILSDEIRDKGRIIDLRNLWNSKSQKNKEKILEAFSLDSSLLSDIKNYSTVLVTQVLPIPEKDKIEIYKKLVKDVDESKLLIKTHYAEKTKYDKFFPKAKIVSAPIPFQLFDLIGFYPSTLLTISSSAILPFIREGVKVTFLGTEIDERIKKVYGVIRLSDFSNKVVNDLKR